MNIIIYMLLFLVTFLLFSILVRGKFFSVLVMITGVPVAGYCFWLGTDTPEIQGICFLAAIIFGCIPFCLGLWRFGSQKRESRTQKTNPDNHGENPLNKRGLS